MSVFGRVVIYTKNIDAMVHFYTETFEFEVERDPADRIVELRHLEGGGVINLHPAAKSQKMGQALVKLCFDVEDVDAFVAKHTQFGLVHRTADYAFSNAKDPSGNTVQVTSRAFRGG